LTHLKSLAAPYFYPSSQGVFAAKPRPGPHPADRSLPLVYVVRDILGLAEDARTARILIKEGKFYVDGRPVRDTRFAIGLMDVLTVKELDEYYRILISPGKGLRPVKISAEESSFKVCQVTVKVMTRGGRLQLGLHDGRSILLDADDDMARSTRRLDSLKITIPDQKILDISRLEKNSYALIHSGSKAGHHGLLTEVQRDMAYPARPTVTIETATGTLKTTLSNIMPVGVERPWITLP
jgi:small subunit ribosomal protein S4e